MLLIVEGPDGAGKTTLISSLRKKLSKPSISLRRGGRRLSRDGIRDFHLLISEINDFGLFNWVILDREPLLSESIYGSVIRRDLDAPSTHEVIEAYKRLPPFIMIYCMNPTKPDVEPQMEGVLESLGDLQREYDRLICKIEEIIPQPLIAYALGDPIDPLVEHLERTSENAEC